MPDHSTGLPTSPHWSRSSTASGGNSLPLARPAPARSPAATCAAARRAAVACRLVSRGHGPYRYLSRTARGRSVVRVVPPEGLDSVKGRIPEHQCLQTLKVRPVEVSDRFTDALGTVLHTEFDSRPRSEIDALLRDG